ncbi:MAG: zinc-binding alcohol dehydrogenase [Ruminococcaceae bacterium]|nr:zinc-binding alcohol dehydrogenase [Oscillospiraceae bacterium]
MKIKQIIFTEINKAELLDVDLREPRGDEVLVKTDISTISAGTERANVTGDPNVNANGASGVVFPRSSGYNSVGTVVAIGPDVKSVAVGDRVVVYWGKHRSYNLVHEINVVKVESAAVSNSSAAMSFIASFPLAAIRKTRIEMGESAMVMGLGILGLIGVKLLRAAGAVPIIAVDPNPKRREIAKACGADFTFDPFEEGFAEKVKAVTGGGVNVAIEVTGVGAGFNESLDCMAKFGRVALLGCTRNSDFTVDYYKKIHSPGITVIGAHTIARPEYESHPGWFTHRDDISAILALISGGRIELDSLVSEVHSPNECGEVYERLVFDKDFPIGVQFDWTRL